MKRIVAVALVGVFACGARAQDKPKPPPGGEGKPPSMANSPLKGHPPRLTVTPQNDIAVSRLKVPAGFKVELWASGFPGGRAMALSDSGKKVYLGSRVIGRVYEVTDDGQKRTVRTVIDKLTMPAGVAFKDGALWVFAIDRVLRFDGIEGNPEVQPVDLTAKFDLPPQQHHNWKYVAFGPDGKIYVPFGAPCNICEPPKEYAQIRRYNADGSGKEVVALGVRNTVGFDWHPKTKELWFTDHGRDWMGENTPHDELNRVSKPGLNFGFPYCHAEGVADPDVKKADPCNGVTKPVALMGPHTAVMGVKFYTGDMFPASYKETMFIARRGSWNRTNLSGFDVVTVKASPDGKGAKVTPFLTGFMDPKTNDFWGRPVYLLQMTDGALLVSDEQNGAIYRISYEKPKPAAKKQ